jgi:peptide/nickel transport system substrate-binding protein
MKRSRIAAPLLIAAATIAALTASSAGGAVRAKQVPLFVYGIGTPVSTLDPNPIGGNGGAIDSLGLEYLLKLNSSGQIVPNLAQSVTNPTPAIYVYHLRHGVKFWDGKEMTATDVAQSINYQRYPGSNTTLSGATAKIIKTVTATNKYTVTVVLRHPDAAFQYILAGGGYIWEASQQSADPLKFGKPGTLLVGTGPYEFQSLDPATGAELTANPHYWGGTPVFKHISVKVFGSEQSAALAFRAGDIDAYFPTGAASFASTAGTTLLQTPGLGQGRLWLDVNQAPFNDVHFRRAIAYAINKADVIATTGQPAAPSYTLPPSVALRAIGTKAQLTALLKSIPTYAFDLSKAKAELARSAYPNGTSVHLDTISFFSPEAQAIAGDLAKINVNVKVNVLSIAAYVGELFNPSDQFGWLFSTFTPPSADPSWFTQLKLPKVTIQILQNNYPNQTAYDLAEQGLRTSNPAKRWKIYSDYVKLMANEVPYIPLYQGAATLALSSKFADPSFSAYTATYTPWILGIKPKA